MVEPTTAPTVSSPVSPADMSVPDIARAINAAVAQMAMSVRTSLARAIEIGELLIEAKKRVEDTKPRKMRVGGPREMARPPLR
jgi:hypothetical protein